MDISFPPEKNKASTRWPAFPPSEGARKAKGKNFPCLLWDRFATLYLFEKP